jgi:hypothetical protein
MKHCNMNESTALFSLPYARGLQYIHAALLSEGATCVRPQEEAARVDSAFAKNHALARTLEEPEWT